VDGVFNSVITPDMQLILRLIKRCFPGVQSLADFQPSFMALIAIILYIYIYIYIYTNASRDHGLCCLTVQK